MKKLMWILIIFYVAMPQVAGASGYAPDSVGVYAGYVPFFLRGPWCYEETYQMLSSCVVNKSIVNLQFDNFWAPSTQHNAEADATLKARFGYKAFALTPGYKYYLCTCGELPDMHEAFATFEYTRGFVFRATPIYSFTFDKPYFEFSFGKDVGLGAGILSQSFIAGYDRRQFSALEGWTNFQYSATYIFNIGSFTILPNLTYIYVDENKFAPGLSLVDDGFYLGLGISYMFR